MLKLLFFFLSFQGTQEAVSFSERLAKAGFDQQYQKVSYDPSYYVISYPNGDVPPEIGVCTDVIIRAYRKVGHDLQQLIHEDMKSNFAVYNKRRKSNKIDSNIDHRRTPNMETFFTRQGAKLSITNRDEDYLPGDIVFWKIATGHVGLVTQLKVPGTNRYYVVHNICCGNKVEDYLFNAEITGHYRWNPEK